MTSRRLFLKFAWVFLASIGLGTVWFRRSQRRTPAPLAEEYLRLFPHERDVSCLNAALFGSFDAGSPSESARRQKVAEAVQEDLKQENVVEIAGWVLARSEARYAAWLYLHKNGGGR